MNASTARKIPLKMLADFRSGVHCPTCKTSSRLEYRTLSGKGYCSRCGQTWHTLDYVMAHHKLGVAEAVAKIEKEVMG